MPENNIRKRICRSSNCKQTSKIINEIPEYSKLLLVTSISIEFYHLSRINILKQLSKTNTMVMSLCYKYFSLKPSLFFLQKFKQSFTEKCKVFCKVKRHLLTINEVDSDMNYSATKSKCNQTSIHFASICILCGRI